MKAADTAALGEIAADLSDRDVWLALIRATFAVAGVSRLGWASRHALALVSEHLGIGADDGEERAAMLSRERLRAFAVCAVAALLCTDALRCEAFVRAFGADRSTTT